MSEVPYRMDVLNRLRYLTGDFRKRLRQKQRQPLAWQPGLPPGLDEAQVVEVCRANFSGQPALPQPEIRYQHLSGWKTSGAYRLQVQAAGKPIQLIFKNAVYSEEEIPALVGLPARPGRPEYILFSQPAGPLAPYLPRVYLAEEVVRDGHYRYLLEDLAQEYQRAYTNSDIVLASQRLPALHLALRDWFQQAQTNGLIRYGREFSLALQVYANQALTRFAGQVDEPNLRAVLDQWHDITALHAQEEFFHLQPELPIHGDPNFTNIHLHKRDHRRIKLVDWEWAGIGLPHSDLASLLKGAPEYVKQEGFKNFIVANTVLNSGLTARENWRLYLWSRIERGLLDAAFLALQSAHTSHDPKFDLSRAVSQALARVLLVYRLLTQ